MSQSLNLKISGLYTNPNQFSEVPKGSLSVAKNIVIDKGGVAESRRGFQTFGSSLSSKINAIFEYQDTLIIHSGINFYRDSGSFSWSQYAGGYTQETGYRVKATEANKNIYFSTSSGVVKLSSATGTIATAGMPKSLDGTGTTTHSATGFLAPGFACAYRLVLGFNDSNNNLLLSSPSGRTVISHASGGSVSALVDLTYRLPRSITTDYFYQLYRSPQVASPIEPSDELQLAYEGKITSTNVTNKTITIQDIVPDSLLGAYLYTNPTQEGILSSNEQPPVCTDICTFKNITFFANTKTKQRLFITLIATMAVGDTITINSVTYIGVSSSNPSIPNREFRVYTSGTTSENVTNTAFSLLNTINGFSGNTSINAYYMSAYNDLPGKILLETEIPTNTEFRVSFSNQLTWNPKYNGANTYLESSNDSFPNRIYFSKKQQPEAVPILNYLDCGSATESILRIIPLKDSVFIMKSTSMYRIIGEDSTSLRLSLFDNAVNFYAPESAVLCDSQIYCHTDQGFASISDNGIQIVSRPIEDQIIASQQISGFATDSFAIGYDVDRKYIFFCKESASDDIPTKAYVYNYFTNSWTTWKFAASAGLIPNYLNKICLGGSGYKIKVERKTFTKSDFCDNEVNVIINSYSGYHVTLNTVSDIYTGNILLQGSNESIITSVNTATNTVTVSNLIAWDTTGSQLQASVYTQIPLDLQWTVETAENPGILKHFREMTILFREANYSKISLGFSSNFSKYFEYTDVFPLQEDGWGSSWGSMAWGGGGSTSFPVRTYIPLQKRRCNWLTIRTSTDIGKNIIQIQGLSIFFEEVSPRFK
ncbi:hypothetical protein UFOVP683_16 [uncultured Caudovirales phage]|uniref:Uncharacterized protein n=1 Tax=uncultured Caudovirales phage TaxID=2100421 RepID=A0A6J5NJD5_9CAUD|nr:hypothetical protein UFOVP683_16 [uncultured Caudovirales phage]